MNSWFRRQAGFTLVELMMGLTITVILLSAMVPLLSTSIQAWRNGSSRSEVQQTVRFAVDSIIRDLQYGSNYAKVSDWEISFTDSRGLSAGYRLNTTNHILYKVLSNGTVQPLTGTTGQSTTNVLVYGDYGASAALFNMPTPVSGKVEDRRIEIYFLATDTVTGQSMRIHTAVYGISRFLR